MVGICCDRELFTESVRALPPWNPARHRSAVTQIGSPNLFRQDRLFVEGDKEVGTEKPERAKEQNCLRLLEETEASEEEQSTDVHRVADDSIRADGNELFWGIERGRRPPTLNDEQDNASNYQTGSSHNGQKS